MDQLIFILVLAVVVTIHEFGHYTFARLMGVKVKRLQLFFYSFYSFKPRPSSNQGKGTSWRDTEYAIGWLPFGGFTSYSMRPRYIVTSPDGSQHIVVGDPSVTSIGPDTYYDTKSAWRRLLISIGGVLFNILTALIIYVGIIMLSDTDGSIGFLDELSAGFSFMVYGVGSTFSNILGMFGLHIGNPNISPEHYDIIRSFLATASEHTFLIRIADLSTVLFLINILPILPLDGGHAILEIYEIFTGKEPSERFKRYASIVGSIIFIIVFWILPMITSK